MHLTITTFLLCLALINWPADPWQFPWPPRLLWPLPGPSFRGGLPSLVHLETSQTRGLSLPTLVYTITASLNTSHHWTDAHHPQTPDLGGLLNPIDPPWPPDNHKVWHWCLIHWSGALAQPCAAWWTFLKASLWFSEAAFVQTSLLLLPWLFSSWPHFTLYGCSWWLSSASSSWCEDFSSQASLW